MKDIEELIAAIRGHLVGLRTVPFSSVNATGEAIEWKLRDLEKAVRSLSVKYDYARDAATLLYRRGVDMRNKQKRYFKERTVIPLQESKDAERVFDEVLVAISKHGKPQQAELPLGAGAGAGAGAESEVRHG